MDWTQIVPPYLILDYHNSSSQQALFSYSKTILMGFISNLFNMFKHQEYIDPELGMLISDRDGNWNGLLMIQPSEIMAPFSIPGAPNIPVKEQLDFIQQVRDRFAEVESKLSKTMFLDIDPLDTGASPEEVFSHMKLTSIFFSNPIVSPVEWEIWYKNDLDKAGHSFCVEMRDWKYDGFSMNG